MRVVNFISVLFISYCSIYAQEIPSVLICKCVEKINKDYGAEGLTGEMKWLKFENTTPLRDKIFVNLVSDTPTINSIAPPYKYFPEGEVNEYVGTVIHRTKNLILVKWENSFKNKVWIASINVKLKKAIVTESYDRTTSFGMNIEILNCK